MSLEYSMNIKLLTEHHLEFLRLKGGCICLSESTLVKIPHCWKSYSWLICSVWIRKSTSIVQLDLATAERI